ncbi:hypothetical protein [Arthrobacter castelli]|uniref:hypothetical protein n=1 Tax=Arthrobacter castelli TaxID=271431 RepID=UPI000420C9C9|nr:hypothetical protein [Arthrobacter castelli]
MERPTRWHRVSILVAFLPVAAAAAVGVFADFLLQSSGGAALLAGLACVLVVALIVLDVPAAIDAVEGNTFSELLRQGGRQMAVIPWTLGIFAGRWFHPFDGLDVLGADGKVVLLAVTFVVVVGTHLCRQYIRPVPSWLIVVGGLISGALLWPVG